MFSTTILTHCSFNIKHVDYSSFNESESLHLVHQQTLTVVLTSINYKKIHEVSVQCFDFY